LRTAVPLWVNHLYNISLLVSPGKLFEIKKVARLKNSSDVSFSACPSARCSRLLLTTPCLFLCVSASTSRSGSPEATLHFSVIPGTAIL
jgi:hypothetical protein